MPRQFFDSHVLPNYRDWMAQPLDQRLAKNAVSDANNMAARVFRYWKDIEPQNVFNAQNEGEYRSRLTDFECVDFGLVRDIADAHKHVALERPSRLVSRADQTEIERLGWGVARWGEGRWGSPPQLVVTLDDGTKRPLTAVMKNVIGMWERLLAVWRL
jgi:hypothetical protein